jgi:type II secretory pathway component PulF
MKTVLLSLADKVDKGGTLNEAMAEYPRVFREHVLGAVAAGEVAGLLPIVLDDIALDYEFAMMASNRIWKWFSRVLWILAITTVPTATVMPIALHSLFAGARGAIMEYMNQFFRIYLPLMTIPPLAFFIGAWWLKLPQNRRLYYRLELKVPKVSSVSANRSLAAFTRMLCRLQNAGIMPTKAWEVASRVPENLLIADRLQAQTPMIARGGRFSDALMATGLFPNDSMRLLATGESSGQVADSLQRIATYYQEAAKFSAQKANVWEFDIALTAFLIVTGVTMITNFHGYATDIFPAVDKFMGSN